MKFLNAAYYLYLVSTNTCIAAQASRSAHAPAMAPTLRMHKENLSQMITGHRDLLSSGDYLDMKQQVTDGAVTALADLFQSRLHISSHHAYNNAIDAYAYDHRRLQEATLNPSSSPTLDASSSPTCVPT